MKNIKYIILALSINTLIYNTAQPVENEKAARITLQNDSGRPLFIRYFYPTYNAASCPKSTDIATTEQTDTSNCIHRELTPRGLTSFFIYKEKNTSQETASGNRTFPFGFLLITAQDSNKSTIAERTVSDFGLHPDNNFTTKYFYINKDYDLIAQQ